jgi:hypothetical protein
MGNFLGSSQRYGATHQMDGLGNLGARDSAFAACLHIWLDRLLVAAALILYSIIRQILLKLQARAIGESIHGFGVSDSEECNGSAGFVIVNLRRGCEWRLVAVNEAVVRAEMDLYCGVEADRATAALVPMPADRTHDGHLLHRPAQQTHSTSSF